MAVLTQPARREAHAASATPAAAEFVHVSRTYSSVWLFRQRIEAVHDVSLRIAAGEVFGLLGPNRAGKTTLVNAPGLTALGAGLSLLASAACAVGLLAATMYEFFSAEY